MSTLMACSARHTSSPHDKQRALCETVCLGSSRDSVPWIYYVPAVPEKLGDSCCDNCVFCWLSVSLCPFKCIWLPLLQAKFCHIKFSFGCILWCLHTNTVMQSLFTTSTVLHAGYAFCYPFICHIRCKYINNFDDKLKWLETSSFSEW